ncbi:MAG: hypothetical protein J6W82_09610 [Bacteroidales bacterium]|nr:hypothetical protein [Bacteroidales bacterium]
MKIEMLQIALENSRKYSNVFRMGDDMLLVPTEYGLDGIHSTVSVIGESGCLFKHPAVLYETPAQAELFLDKCNSTSIEHTGIEFHDDPIAKCIMAVKKSKVYCKWTFLRNVAEDLMEFTYCVKAIRDSIATVVLDTISPVSINEPVRSLFYLSLMQSYHCPWGWGTTWGGQIDWNDIHTLWKQSKSTFFMPLIKEGTFDNEIEHFLGGAPGYVIAYFGFAYYTADTCDLLGIDDLAKRIYTKYGCRMLKGINIVDSMAAPSKIALVAILKF